MTQSSQSTRLLAAILDGQDETDITGSLTDARIREALSNGKGFNAQERLLIWRSPTARQHFLDVRREFRWELDERVRQAGLGYVDIRLAASGNTWPMEIVGHGFVVTIFGREEPGDDFMVSVQLSSEYLALLPPSTVVNLKDSGGAIWASGVPDEQNCIGSVWGSPGETPDSRLRLYQLKLDPGP